MIGSVSPHSRSVCSVLPPSNPQDEEMTISAPSSWFSSFTFSGSIRPPVRFLKKSSPARTPSMSKEDETFFVSPRTDYGRFFNTVCHNFQKYCISFEDINFLDTENDFLFVIFGMFTLTEHASIGEQKLKFYLSAFDFQFNTVETFEVSNPRTSERNLHHIVHQ